VTAARLSDSARAVIAWVRRRGPVTSDQIWDEFVRRGYYPETIDSAQGEALAAGAIVQDGDELRPGPAR